MWAIHEPTVSGHVSATAPFSYRSLFFLTDPMAGSYGMMGDDDSIDYTVHEAWNEATNVYLIVILVSFGLFMYAKR